VEGESANPIAGTKKRGQPSYLDYPLKMGIKKGKSSPMFRGSLAL
jgi:hypothetical protein